MASYQINDKMYVYANGALLGMADSVTVEYQGDPIVIATLANDFVGVYPVPKHAIVSVENFVSTAGMEFDAVEKWLNTEEVAIKTQMGGSGEVFDTSGFVMAPSISSSPTNPTKMTFKVAVAAKKFK